MCNEIKLKTILRLAACTTTDTITRNMCLNVLGETSVEALSEINETCWNGTNEEIIQSVLDAYGD